MIFYVGNLQLSDKILLEILTVCRGKLQIFAPHTILTHDPGVILSRHQVDTSMYTVHAASHKNVPLLFLR